MGEKKMIVEDVRIETKETTSGHQHDESYITYYDIQVSVFGNWWSLVKDPEKQTDLTKVMEFRDTIRDMIRGKN